MEDYQKACIQCGANITCKEEFCIDCITTNEAEKEKDLIVNIDDDKKTCLQCGNPFKYKWEGVGELNQEICISCLQANMTPEEREHDIKNVSSKWLEALNS